MLDSLSVYTPHFFVVGSFSYWHKTCCYLWSWGGFVYYFFVLGGGVCFFYTVSHAVQASLRLYPWLALNPCSSSCLCPQVTCWGYMHAPLWQAFESLLFSYCFPHCIFISFIMSPLPLYPQIPKFRGPQALGPVPAAVGVSIAIDKIFAAVLNMEEPVSPSAFQHALRHLHSSVSFDEKPPWLYSHTTSE